MNKLEKDYFDHEDEMDEMYSYVKSEDKKTEKEKSVLSDIKDKAKSKIDELKGEKRENDDYFWPRKVKIQDVLSSSLWALLSWIIASVIMLIFIYIFSGIIDIFTNFERVASGISVNKAFSVILLIIAFLGTTASSFITYFFFHLIDPEKYRKNSIQFFQLSFLIIIIFLLFAPVYIYIWLYYTENLMIVFIFHIITLVFWFNILLEVLNSYRYVLIGFYGSFIWMILSSYIWFYVFYSVDSTNSRLIILLLLLPLINSLTVFFKYLFEMFYYNYYKYTWNDQLWDIFYQIEQEEKEDLKLAEEKNMI